MATRAAQDWLLSETPNKGFLFSEPLAHTGSTDKAQIYGEISLEYGPEIAHGKVTGLTTAARTGGSTEVHMHRSTSNSSCTTSKSPSLTATPR